MIKQLSKQTFLFGLGNALASLGIILLIPLYTRALSQPEYGSFEMIVLSVSLLYLILENGLSSAVFRFVIRKDVTNSVQAASTIFLGTLVIAVITGTIIYMFRAGLSLRLLGSTDFSSILVWSGVFLIGRLLLAVPLALLRVDGQTVAYGLTAFIRLAAQVILGVYLVLNRGLGLVGAVMALAVATWFQLLTVILFVRKYLQPKWSWSFFRRVWFFALPFVLLNLSLMGLASIDRFLVKHALGLGAVAVYSINARMTLVIVLVVQAFQLAWPPVYFGQHQNPDAGLLFARASRYLLIVMGFVGVAITVFSDEILTILAPSSYSAGLVVVPWLCLANIFYGVFIATAIGFNVRDRTWHVSWIGAAAVFIQLAFGLLLTPRLGMLGAALATVLGYFTLLVTSLCVCLYLYPVPYEWKRLGGIALAATMASIANKALDLQLSNPSMHFVVDFSSIVAYVGLLVFFRGVSRQEIKLMIAEVNRFRVSLSTTIRK